MSKRLFSLVLLCSFLVVGACGSASANDGKSPAPRIPELSERLQQFVENKLVSGIVTLVARRGRIVHFDAIGMSNLEAGTPMQPDAVFRIASMTKPITATAVMILQDEGKLSVDDPVAKFVPEFNAVRYRGKPLRRAITLRDLMSHTSGVVGKQDNEGTLQETAVAMARRPLGFEPGSKWEYGPGLSVCGRVIEVASGRSYEAFLRERIFAPLRMVDTTFHPSPEQKKRAATLYKAVGDPPRLVPAHHWLVDVDERTVPNPSGGLYSTATDLARFYQMILNGGELDGKRIVSAEAIRQMTIPQTDGVKEGVEPGMAWGLGWAIVRDPQAANRVLSPGSFGHGGAFGTLGWVEPKRQMVYVFLIQRLGLSSADATELRRTFHETAVHALGG